MLRNVKGGARACTELWQVKDEPSVGIGSTVGGWLFGVAGAHVGVGVTRGRGRRLATCRITSKQRGEPRGSTTTAWRRSLCLPEASMPENSSPALERRAPARAFSLLPSLGPPLDT
jgi:hypothetical protein